MGGPPLRAPRRRGHRAAHPHLEALRRPRLDRLTFELFVPARLDVIDPESRLIADADERAAIAALHDAVAALPPDEARVVHLHYVEQLPLRQIAEQLGVSHAR